MLEIKENSMKAVKQNRKRRRGREKGFNLLGRALGM